MENMQIPIILTIGQINQILAVLSEKPLKEVVDLFSAIKSQGDRVVLAAQQEEQRRLNPPPPTSPPVSGIDMPGTEGGQGAGAAV